VSGEKEFFAEMVVEAVSKLDPTTLDLKMIGIKKVIGGGLRDSFLVDGVAFKKTFSYAGFEQQPKSFDTPKILLLNIELELKAEKENAEVRSAAGRWLPGAEAQPRPAWPGLPPLHFDSPALLPPDPPPPKQHAPTPAAPRPVAARQIRLDDPGKYQSIVDAEWNIIYDKLKKCVDSGANIVLSRLAIGEPLDAGTRTAAPPPLPFA
jgi:hypothetical protein